MFSQCRNITHVEIAGIRQVDFPMGRNVAENERQAKTYSLEHRDRLSFVTGGQDEHGGVREQFGQCRAGLLSEHDNAASVGGGVGDGAPIAS